MSEFTERNGLYFDWMLPSYVVKPSQPRKEIKFHQKDNTDAIKLETHKPWTKFKIEETVHDSRETLRKVSAILASKNQRIWIAKSTAGAKG